MSSIVEKYTAFLERRGRIVILGTVLVMIGAAFGIARLSIRTDFDIFMPPDSPHRVALDAMSESFGDSGQIVALADVTDLSLPMLPRIATELSALPGVVSAQSPVPESIASLEGTEQANALQRFLEMAQDSVLVDYEGATYALFRILTSSDVHLTSLMSGIEESFAEHEVSVSISGEPYLEAKIFSYILRIFLTIPPIAITLMLLVFRSRIGSMRATVLSLVPAIAGAAITLGGIGWVIGDVSMVTVLVPIYVIVLGSADGLHVTSHVIDSVRSGASNSESVTRTLKAVGVPIVMTTVTTMAGFLSLLVINSKAMQTLGAASAVGMLIAGIATWVILPTVLLHQKPLKGRRNRSHDWTHRILSRLRGWPSITIAVVLIAAFVPGVLMVRANFSMVDIYRRGTEVRKNLELMTDIVGGSIPVYLTYPADGSFDPATAAAVLEFQDRVVDGGIVGRAVSAYDIIRTQWENATGNTGYPERQVLARTIATRIKLTNPTALDMFFSEDDTGRAVFFLRDLDDATLTAFLTTVDEVAASTGLAMRPVGTAFVMKAMNDQIIPQQVTSLLLAAAMVFVLISITQRSLKLGIAATIPILITLVVLFGVMGYARIDLSVITGIMSGLTIGVGIDYAIHYVALLRQARRRGESDPPDVALRYVATPVLANALGLAIGFTAMVSSPLQIHVTLSILMWVTMIVSAGLSLTFLPTITSRRPLAAHVREGGELRKPEGARDE